jgi:hypothetical protein
LIGTNQQCAERPQEPAGSAEAQATSRPEHASIALRGASFLLQLPCGGVVHYGKIGKMTDRLMQ